MPLDLVGISDEIQRLAIYWDRFILAVTEGSFEQMFLTAGIFAIMPVIFTVTGHFKIDDQTA